MSLLAGDTEMSGEGPLVSLRGVSVRYHARGRSLLALEDVNFDIWRGECVGLVGGSGSGKTTLARLLVGLVRPESGTVTIAGRSLGEWMRTDRRRFRREVQMIFQDPYGSLNPRMTVRQALREALRVHRVSAAPSEEDPVDRLLRQVGLDASYGDRFPFELSGGQRQRVGIARALAVRPELLIADEPVSALDVSVQAHVLNLLLDLHRAGGLTLLLVAHDLAAVRYVCRRIVVLHRGRIVEDGPVERLFENPGHPHTRELLQAVPDLA